MYISTGTYGFGIIVSLVFYIYFTYLNVIKYYKLETKEIMAISAMIVVISFMSWYGLLLFGTFFTVFIILRKLNEIYGKKGE